MLKRLLLIAGIVGITANCVVAADTVEKTGKKEKNMYLAIIETSMGDMVCELFDKESPKTVANFVGLANGTKEFTDPRTGQKTKKRFYDGLTFHRVIPEFMIQGGDPLGTGTGGPGYRFEDEISPNLKFDRPGRIAMANAGPNTNGSQFFITEAATPWLDGHYSIFGQVIMGQDVVNRIARVERGLRDKPVKDIVIKKVTIENNDEVAIDPRRSFAAEKVLFVVAPNNFRDEEYGEPRKILQSANKAVVTASLATGELTGTLGGKVTADLVLNDVKPADYAAVAFIGGAGAQALFDNPEAQRIAKEFASQGKPVAAICIAPSILAKAGVLNGKKATAFPSEKDVLTANGATFTGTTVERDGNIITASGPQAAKEFGEMLLKALEK